MEKKRVLIITHNYPKNEKDSSGIWIKRLWEGFDKYDVFIMPIPKIPLRIFFYLRLIKFVNPDIIVAYWMAPAGVLAYLSGVKYILNCVGIDVYKTERSWVWRTAMWPIVNKAETLIFIGNKPMQVLTEVYPYVGWKSKLIYLPMGSQDAKNPNNS